MKTRNAFSIANSKSDTLFTLTLLWVVAALVWYSLQAMTPRVLFLKTFPRYHGTASWYSESDAYINRFTASGEVFDDEKATCASRDFPFGTYLKITNVKDGKFVICRVNDRGPKESLNRAIDLTKCSFQKIADPGLGLIEVTITPLPQIGILRENKAFGNLSPHPLDPVRALLW